MTNKQQKMKETILECCRVIIDGVDEIVSVKNVHNINIEFDAMQEGQIPGIKYWYDVWCEDDK